MPLTIAAKLSIFDICCGPGYNSIEYTFVKINLYVHMTEGRWCLIWSFYSTKSLTHFRPMFHLRINQALSFS